jgi:hypothetical protein
MTGALPAQTNRKLLYKCSRCVASCTPPKVCRVETCLLQTKDLGFFSRSALHKKGLTGKTSAF